MHGIIYIFKTNSSKTYSLVNFVLFLIFLNCFTFPLALRPKLRLRKLIKFFISSCFISFVFVFVFIYLICINSNVLCASHTHTLVRAHPIRITIKIHNKLQYTNLVCQIVREHVKYEPPTRCRYEKQLIVVTWCLARRYFTAWLVG